jgi:hypothetical protein
VALGDVDGDGDLDLVSGNLGGWNRLYLNNGTADPWNGVIGSNITADVNSTYSVILGDVDDDGDLDLVAGNAGSNRLYLNNGTADPWNGVIGSDITADSHTTLSVALGDVDNDGDLDLVAGNDEINRLYLNDGTGGFPAGSDIPSDPPRSTFSVALSDVNGDGHLDLIEGNWQGTSGLSDRENRLCLNDGTGDFPSGSDITSDSYDTISVALGDVDRDLSSGWTRLICPAQAGADLYEVARSTMKDLSGGCETFETAEPTWTDGTVPAAGTCYHYLMRPLLPNVGSWGQQLDAGMLAERTGICP